LRVLSLVFDDDLVAAGEVSNDVLER